MAEITAQVIKELREATGAGMMDCKKALAENDGDIEAAKDWLRTKGLSAAAKKSGRVASEGLVAINVNGTQAAIVELNSETDFVAKNDQFQALAAQIAQTAQENGANDAEALKEQTNEATGKSVGESITDAIAVIGENMNLRRVASVSADTLVASYVHSAQADGMGKIGVLVALKAEGGNEDALQELGRQIAMHVAAAKPEALTVEELDADSVEREREIFREQARASGKPEEIIEKMIEGRMRKYYEQVVLPYQAFVIDGKTPIKDVLKEAEKDVGASVEIQSFVQFTLGEGIEKKEEDFAAEVAATVNAA